MKCPVHNIECIETKKEFYCPTCALNNTLKARVPHYANNYPQPLIKDQGEGKEEAEHEYYLRKDAEILKDQGNGDHKNRADGLAELVDILRSELAAQAGRMFSEEEVCLFAEWADSVTEYYDKEYAKWCTQSTLPMTGFESEFKTTKQLLAIFKTTK